MERLTKKHERGYYMTIGPTERGNYDAIQRLGELEDAEEQLLKAAGVDLQSMVGEFMHYYTLQKEGRLVELPCKVGDTVYEANHFWNRVIERNVAFVLICKSSIYVKNGCGDSFEFGKECFLTREEAEAALERMENE